jgi:hypothetical protein
VHAVQDVAGVVAGVIGWRVAKVAGQGAAIDLEVPAAAGAAGAAQCSVAEREVPVLSRGAAGTLEWLPVDDERTADANPDE